MESFDLFAILLGTLIKIVLAYILLGVFCVFITEGFSSILNRRGKLLKRGLEKFADDQLIARIYVRPSIKVLGTSPSYIRPQQFAKALLQVINGDTEVNSLLELKDKVCEEKSAIKDHQNPLCLLVKQIIKEQETMLEIIDEVSLLFLDIAGSIASRYKRDTQLIVVASALVLTVTLNIDTIRMFKKMYSSTIAERILTSLKDDTSDTIQSKALILSEIKNSTPIGWDVSSVNEGIKSINLEKILGWLMTVVMATGGASLIFQYLSRHVDLRDSRKPSAAK